MNQHDPYQSSSGPAPGPPHAAVPAPYAPGPVPLSVLPPAPTSLATATVLIAGMWALVQTMVTLSFLVAFPAGQRALEAGQALPAGFALVYDVVGYALVPVSLAAYVVGCLWLSQSRQFAQAVAPQFPHARDAVWVWLGWVIPVVAFWFPLQVVRDVRAATVDRRSATGLAVWWSAWLLSFVRITFWSNSDPSLVPQLVSELVTGVATLIAAVMWVRIVREITSAQRARIQAVSSAPIL